MQDFDNHDSFNNLPVYTAEDWHSGAVDYWRKLILERWKTSNYLHTLTKEETASSHLWRMPDWASDILDRLATEQCRGVVPNWAEAVMAICLHKIDNLQEINWGQATDGWRYGVFDKILACIPDGRLAVAILQCAIKKAEADFSVDFPDDLRAIVTYCQKQIEYIQSRDMFDLATILQADRARLDDVEKRLGEVESKVASLVIQMPAELDSEDAQAILQRAVDAGLCEPKKDGRYKWLKTKRLCAYFADVATLKLGISKAKSSNNMPHANFKPFEVLFQMETLKQDKANYRTEGKLPGGYEIVDKIVQG